MDWKWMIERGGRMTFTVISTPTHTDTPPHPAFLEHTEKPSDIESYSGHFGSTCNERKPYRRLRKIFAVSFVSPHVFCGHHNAVQRYPETPFLSEVDEKDTGETATYWQAHPKLCGRWNKYDTDHFSEISKFGSSGYSYCMPRFLKSCYLLFPYLLCLIKTESGGGGLSVNNSFIPE